MKAVLTSILALAGVAMAIPAAAQITFFEREGFTGQSFTTEQPIRNFERYGFNDRASSVVVARERWEVCEDARFNGRCVILRPGNYPSLAAMGLDNRVSSVRTVGGNERFDDNRYAPAPGPADNSYRRHDNERLYEATVTSVHAVVGPPQQRCWIEHQPVMEERSKANVPAALAGAVIGGILGHQVGAGRGRDLATAGGAVAGAAVGANVGRDGGGHEAGTQDVQRCDSTPSQGRPDYWDVTYNFRGQEHRVQVTAPPGPTIIVNERGEPRS